MSSLRKQGPITTGLRRKAQELRIRSASRHHGTLYIGVTNSLQKRLEEHRTSKGSSFVKAYGIHRLVYVEFYERADEAIAREKQLKRWKRDWKIELIERENLEWRDLSDLPG